MKPPDLVILGRICGLAGDEGFGWIEGIACRDGRVAAAGRRVEIEALAGPGTRRLELGPDLVVVPGLTDAHLHLVDAALAGQQLQLGPDEALASAVERIGELDRARRERGDSESWLLGRGWSFDGFGGWPPLGALELAAPGRPIALWAHDHHARWLSPAAMRRAGIDATTPDPPGGSLVRAADRRPTGVCLEHAARLVEAAIPQPEAEQLAAAVDDYAARLLGLGIVAVHDPGEVAPEPGLARGPRLYARLAAQGRLRLRVHASVHEDQLERAVDMGLSSGAGEGRARVGWLKLFADGSLGSRTAWLLTPYADTGTVGRPLLQRNAIEDLVRRGAAAGLAPQVHAIGDRAVRVALDVLAGVPEARTLPVAARIEHAQLVARRDVRRFGQLGVAASVQPAHLVSDGPAAGLAWPDRLADAYRWRSFETAGATLAFGSDAPVDAPDPWAALAIAVTRRATPEAARFPGDEALSVAAALRAAAVGPAELAGERSERGRLVAGARADLVVIPAAALDEDPVRPGGALASARPLLTLVDGEEAWRDPAFDR